MAFGFSLWTKFKFNSLCGLGVILTRIRVSFHLLLHEVARLTLIYEWRITPKVFKEGFAFI